MAIAGSISPTGGAPRPDPERVATIRYTIVDDAETSAVFGESVRAALADQHDRALAATSGDVLHESSMLIARIRDCVSGLDPARLEPRRGLAGLFDSRSKRLKAFRATFLSTAERVAASAADLGGRTAALSARETALETLWAQTRDAIADLDAHVAAARDWLSHSEPEPAAPEAPTEASDETSVVEAAGKPHAEPAADPPAHSGAEAEKLPDGPMADIVSADPGVPEEASSAPATEPDPEPALQTAVIEALPHPLSLRLSTLEDARAAAIARLPVLRATQNADWRTPAALNSVSEAVEAWRTDWRDALGLAGKKPRKVRPEGSRLAIAATALIERVEAADRELAAAQSRRTEIRPAA